MASFGISTAVNLVTGGILILLTMAQVHKEVHHYQTTQLIFPVEQPKPYVPPVPKVKLVAPPPRIERPPTITIPQPQPELPKPVAVKLPTPEVPHLAPAPPKAVAPPPQPKVGLFKSATPTQVANNIAVPTVKTGGFGDPGGVTPNPSATRPVTIAAVGSFGSAPGPAQGAGAARQGTVQGTSFGSGVANGVPGGKDRGTVASAGFSQGVVGGTGAPGTHGTVASSGFGTQVATSGSGNPAKVQDVPSTPIVVISKPLPQYTPEAKQLRIEGDVTLEVRFTASGQVEVLRVVNGLGHGLDQQAMIAAGRIRFKPATKNGEPVDQVSIIHISFQLA